MSIVSKLESVRALVESMRGCFAPMEYEAKENLLTCLTLLDELIEGQSDGWMPIESAPKDGSLILVFGVVPYTGEGYTAMGRWVNEEEMFMGDKKFTIGHDFLTHWRPVPQPPKQLTEGDK